MADKKIKNLSIREQIVRRAECRALNVVPPGQARMFTPDEARAMVRSGYIHGAESEKNNRHKATHLAKKGKQ